MIFCLDSYLTNGIIRAPLKSMSKEDFRVKLESFKKSYIYFNKGTISQSVTSGLSVTFPYDLAKN